MLSDEQKIKAFGYEYKKDLPLLDAPQTVRIRFRKVGNLQFISHLDLQRTVHRILVRSSIPVWYTQGFNPHAKITFCMPLSVGTQSECEFLDIRIDRKISLDEIKERLNREVTDEMRILDVYFPKTKFTDAVWVDYDILLYGVGDESTAKTIRALFSLPVMATKKTKAGEKEIDLSSYLKDFSVAAEGEDIRISLRTAAGEGSLNPALLVDAMRREIGLFGEDEDGATYSVMRKELYCADGTVFR